MQTLPDGRQILTGDGTWPFHALLTMPDIRVGDDMIVYGTYFGGDSDPQDNGLTACGFSTKGHPALRGCAIPMCVNGAPSLKGSPLPRMPFGMHSDGTLDHSGAWVSAFCPRTGKSTIVPVIDLGPGKGATSHKDKPHAIDFTIASWADLGLQPGGDPEPIVYRIIGAAHYVGK